jgi:hypothetical protein
MTPNLDATRAWWATHRSRIVAALPLTLGPTTYTTAYPDCVDRWLAIADSLPPPLLEACLLRNLRRIAQHIGETRHANTNA